MSTVNKPTSPPYQAPTRSPVRHCNSTITSAPPYRPLSSASTTAASHFIRQRRCSFFPSVPANLGVFLIERHAVVVEGRRLQDDAGRADHHRQQEHPQEQTVQHHRHVLPVLTHLEDETGGQRSRSPPRKTEISASSWEIIDERLWFIYFS